MPMMVCSWACISFSRETLIYSGIVISTEGRDLETIAYQWMMEHKISRLYLLSRSTTYIHVGVPSIEMTIPE